MMFKAKSMSLKKALDSNDSTRIRKAKDELESHMQHIGEAMSKAGHTGGDASGAGAGMGAGQGEHGQDQAHGEQKQHSHGDDAEEVEAEIIDEKDRQ